MFLWQELSQFSFQCRLARYFHNSCRERPACREKEALVMNMSQLVLCSDKAVPSYSGCFETFMVPPNPFWFESTTRASKHLHHALWNNYQYVVTSFGNSVRDEAVVWDSVCTSQSCLMFLFWIPLNFPPPTWSVPEVFLVKLCVLWK